MWKFQCCVLVKYCDHQSKEDQGKESHKTTLHFYLSDFYIMHFLCLLCCKDYMWILNFIETLCLIDLRNKSKLQHSLHVYSAIAENN